MPPPSSLPCIRLPTTASASPAAAAFDQVFQWIEAARCKEQAGDKSFGRELRAAVERLRWLAADPHSPLDPPARRLAQDQAAFYADKLQVCCRHGRAGGGQLARLLDA